MSFCVALAVLTALTPTHSAAASGAGFVQPGTSQDHLATAIYDACDIALDASVTCWGDNTDGQLGDGTTIGRASPTEASGVHGASVLSTAQYDTCAVSGGTAQLFCWGGNQYGQLGDGTTAAHLTATPVPGMTGVQALAAKNNHTCAVVVGGGLDCWGDNTDGQLGSGTTLSSLQPALVTGSSSYVAVEGGTYFTCAITIIGNVNCWGDNSQGQLGNGTGQSSLVPTQVPTLSNVAVIAGKFAHMCAVLDSGDIDCWGDNLGGLAGNGSVGGEQDTPTPVSGIHTAISVTTGSEHSCALLEDGTVSCWGDNTYGQLGDGTLIAHPLPAPVPGLTDVVAIAAGEYSTCAQTSAGQALCWGDNGYGQLGTGGYNPSSVPKATGGDITVMTLSVSPDNAPAFTPVSLEAVAYDTALRGNPLVAGTMTFFDGTTPIGSAITDPTYYYGAISYDGFAQGVHHITAMFSPASPTVAGSTSGELDFTATAPLCPNGETATLCIDPQSVDATVAAGTITITTPYSPANPLNLGTFLLKSSGTLLSATAAFGGTAGEIFVTDTRAGDVDWVASVQSGNFTSPASPSTPIDGQNAGLVGLTVEPVSGNALTAANVTVTNNPSGTAPIIPGGTQGIGGAKHTFAQTTAGGDGSIGFIGTFTLNAPTSTGAGLYTGTVTFTVG